MILPIKKVTNSKDEKILRSKAAELKFPLSPIHKKLIQDMFETVVAASGIGLAAPQVGVSVRLLVVNLEHLGLPMFALINPVITKFSKNKTELEEGCLSIPGVYGFVDRPEKINFEAYFPNGQKVQATADGLLSKVLQHEVDHLNGILITDIIKRYTDTKTASKRTLG